MSRVTLIGHTTITLDFAALALELGWQPTSNVPGEQLIEFAGRACYQSWSKPNPKTADTAAYIANVMAQKHFSVVEHATAVFYLEDVPRSLTHELVRHRHFSFSQLSQRYVDMAGAEPVIHPTLRGDRTAEDLVETAFISALTHYNALIDHLEHMRPELNRKQVREAAREVLPNCTPTSLVVSGNLRSWLEYVEKRCSPAADAAIREVSMRILEELQIAYPAVFGVETDMGTEQGSIQPEFLTS